jgi:hypothetical protein
MARSHSARIAYRLPRGPKVSLSTLLVLTLVVRITYGAGNDLLFEAVRSGEVRKVRAALSQGIDANSANTSGQTSLMLAAGLGRVDIVNLLLGHHASINAKDDNGVTALMTLNKLLQGTLDTGFRCADPISDLSVAQTAENPPEHRLLALREGVEAHFFMMRITVGEELKHALIQPGPSAHNHVDGLYEAAGDSEARKTPEITVPVAAVLNTTQPR